MSPVKRYILTIGITILAFFIIMGAERFVAAYLSIEKLQERNPDFKKLHKMFQKELKDAITKKSK